MAGDAVGDPVDTVPITVEFTGGLEMLFSNKRKHCVSLPAIDENGGASNLAYLVRYLCNQLMNDCRKELFVSDDTIRPGILVLVNDADWELEGEGAYVLQRGDNILFVSTLHGG
ncbi:MAG: hypothetical protein L6R39_004184 [Caloplaca ligustica]|nr:MAG: hypothetical protein L6R39_004184 [Caloplaca ligustica]